MRRGPDTGGTLHAPLRTKVETGNGATRTAFEDLSYRTNPRAECDMLWDFNGKYASGVGEGLAVRATGTPTGVAQVANTANGEITATLANTNELEFSGVDWTDELNVPASGAYVMFDARVKTPAVALAAVEDVVIGLSAAYNSTLNSIATYARFRLSGSNELLVEGSDGTNIFSVDTGILLPAASYRFFTIEQKRSDGRFYFFVSNDLVGALNLPLLTAAFAVSPTLWQPLVGIRKASGVTVPALTIDHLRVRWLRLT